MTMMLIILLVAGRVSKLFYYPPRPTLTNHPSVDKRIGYWRCQEEAVSFAYFMTNYV